MMYDGDASPADEKLPWEVFTAFVTAVLLLPEEGAGRMGKVWKDRRLLKVR